MELFLLVLRNLLARPVRSLLTLLGVLVATASMVLFLSFGEGLRRALFQELSRVGPAIQVVPEGAEGFVFGALPEIPPETLKALEEAGKALGVRAVVPTLFLTRGALTPAPASSSRACRKEPLRTSSTRGSRPRKAASPPRRKGPWWGPRWRSGAASPWEAS